MNKRKVSEIEKKNVGISRGIVAKEPAVRKKITKRLKHSNFIITINTNKKVGVHSKEAEELAERLEIIGEEVLKELNANGFGFKYLDGQGSWTPQWIKSVETEGTTEIGPKTGFLHLHMMVLLEHWTKVQVDTKELKEYFSEAWGSPVYVNVEYFMEADRAREVLRAYIRKNSSNDSNEATVLENIEQDEDS